jgi:hypothetical protein
MRVRGIFEEAASRVAIYEAGFAGWEDGASEK